MNDLAGLDWNASSPAPPLTQSQSQAQYSAFRPAATPTIPRQPTPLLTQASGPTSRLPPRSNVSGKAQANDSFANLLGPSASKTSTSSLSLQERQKQLLAERPTQSLGSSSRPNQTQVNSYQDAHFWEGLGSGRGTPAPDARVQPSSNIEEDDLLAAFNASAPVDASSHFPPPAPGDPRSISTSPENGFYKTHNNGVSRAGLQQDEDDDPFGLNQLSSKGPIDRTHQGSSNEEDVLGLLGKPITMAQHEHPATDARAQRKLLSEKKPVGGLDRAIAELVDMGFPIDRSREALSNTEGGTNVQEAVSWLLNQAHEESRNKPGPLDRQHKPQDRGRQTQTSIRPRDEESADPVPSWMRRQDVVNRQDSRSPANGEKDVSQYASEIGVSLFKSANSLWKTGQKKVQKVVTELQYESDTSQPKWMRDSQQSDSDSSLSKRPIREQKARAPLQPDVTDEAMMLEAGRGPSKRIPKQPQVDGRLDVRAASPARRPSPLSHANLPERPAPAPAPRPQYVPPQPTPRPAERISRQIVEEQSAEAYISPARRRKAAPKPIERELDMDIFSDVQPVGNSSQPPLRKPVISMPRPPAPTPVRSKMALRTVPSVSASILLTSATKRAAGTASFKRGNYAEAQDHYTAALSPLPPTHPIAIVVRCNRALTNIKVGDPKAAIADADAALEIIGRSRGEDETISLGEEGDKPMKEFYGKALSRKAEALEAMEKWADAAKVWRDAVEAGVGGSVAIQGRNRCEKSSGAGAAATQVRPAAPKPKSSAPARGTAASSRPAALNGLGVGSSGETEAVRRLRQANAVAAAASDEAFALTDVVDARLAAWKGGKADNLRGLLASLDSVLWAEAGWKKVGMADLVMPPRVKIIYMKAIAKVHPDKIPQTATTEQKMISASVFATLNEAWDKFKKDNGM